MSANAEAKAEEEKTSNWHTKLLEKWQEDIRKPIKQREAEAAAAADAAEARMKAADEWFLNRYPHLRPTPERLAALRDSKCAHCAAAYPVWEHVAHFYCSHRCALIASVSS
jgi:hypothetical protein